MISASLSEYVVNEEEEADMQYVDMADIIVLFGLS